MNDRVSLSRRSRLLRSLARVLPVLLLPGLAAPALGEGPPAAVPVDFAHAFNLPVGVSPYFVVAVDLNHDGHLDLAASNTVGHSLTVLLNRGNGTFLPGAEYPTRGFTPYALAAGDLDGDGAPDLVCGNMFSHNISLFFNKGDGTFGDTVNLEGEPGPMFTTLADFNGDGRLDIATSDIGHDDVAIFLNRGERHFEHTGTYRCKGVVPYSVIAADFDKDGDQDLATGNIYSANVSVLMNQGDGKFNEAVTYATDSLTQILFPGDFNRDGYIDLVSGNGGSDNISVLINNGDGTFKKAVNYPVKLPQGVTAGDIDGDGDLDIATANQSAGTTSVLINDGGGSFSRSLDFNVQGLYPTSVLMADLNGDGRVDLATANSGSNDVSVLLSGVAVPSVESVSPSAALRVGLRQGALLAPVTARFNTAIAESSLTGDSVRLMGNQSGVHLSSLRYDAASQTVELQPAKAARRFQPGEQVKMVFSSSVQSTAGLKMNRGYLASFDIEPERGYGRFERQGEVQALKARGELLGADVDGDGHIDLVLVEKGRSTVSLFFNGPQGVLHQRVELSTGGMEPETAVVADFDQNNTLDIAVLNRLSMDISFFYNEGDRRFSAPQKVDAGSMVTGLAASDFNGDGRIDLVLGNRLKNVATLLLNTGGRSFAPPKTVETDHIPMLIACADLNGDGVEDMVAAEPAADSVTVLLGKGDGTFKVSSELHLLPSNVQRILIGDLNQDRAPEILTVNGASGDVAVFPNRGDGSFGTPYYIPAGEDPSGAVLVDVDADGAVELVISHRAGFSVVENPGSKQARERFSVTGKGILALVGADFDGDGAIDLVTGSAADRELSLYLNRAASERAAARP